MSATSSASTTTILKPSEGVICTRTFSTSAVGTTVDDGESPPGSTKLDDETGHNCKMPHNLYRIICTSVLGLPLDSWTNLDCHPHGSGVQKSAPARSRSNNLLLWHQYILYKNAPVSLPRDPKDMATIFVHLTLLVVGADACTPHIHQKQHHVPYSLAISMNGTFLLIHGMPVRYGPSVMYF